MGKEIITQVQETQRVPNRINPRRNTPRHIVIKLTKIKHKEQILKAAREKQQITHKGIPIRIRADYCCKKMLNLVETMWLLSVTRTLYQVTRFGFKCYAHIWYLQAPNPFASFRWRQSYFLFHVILHFGPCENA